MGGTRHEEYQTVAEVILRERRVEAPAAVDRGAEELGLVVGDGLPGGGGGGGEAGPEMGGDGHEGGGGARY